MPDDALGGNTLPETQRITASNYVPDYPEKGLTKTAKGAPDVALENEEGSVYTWADSFAASWSGIPGRILLDENDYESQSIEDMLDRDGKARTVQSVLTLPIRSAPWKIVPGPGDKGEAAFVTDALTRPANHGGMKTPMRLVIAQALSARTHRKACFEKVFTERDGKIVYEKLAFRPSATTAIARDPKSGAFRGFRQRPVSVGGEIWPNIWVDIPAQYSWVHLNNQHINAARGHSDMELIYWLHDKKQKVLFLWMTFLEANATGRYVVQAEDETRAKAYAKALRYVKNGGVLGIGGNEVKVDTLELGTAAAGLFQQMIDYLDNQMAASVLAGFTNLPDSPGGSYALSKDQSDFFLQSLTATAKELAESITNYVLADLVMYNFGPQGVCPSFEFGPLTEGDLETVKALLLGFGTTPTELRVPQAFMTELTRMMGTYLDMPMDEVNKEFDALEERIDQRMDLELQTKQVGLEAQKALAAQGGPQAGAAKGAANAQGKAEMVKAGAKINKAASMVQQKAAAAKGGAGGGSGKGK